MKSTYSLWSIFLLIVMFAMPSAYAQTTDQAIKKDSYTITLKVVDRKTNETLPGVVCTVKNLGVYGVTNNEGIATITKIPAGTIKLEIKYLGFEAWSYEIKVTKSLTLDVRLEETDLSLKEVTVTATRSTNTLSNSSVIGRQAIDHLQASTLTDILELLPGAQMQGQTDKTKGEHITLRTLNSGDKNNSFGTAIIVDGITLSNNANPGDRMSKIQTEGSGVDTRQISADDIESVEVITGVPSAEYGDLTSGAVIVKTKYGATPWNARLKINPNAYNASVSKGVRLKNAGVINASFDYLQAYDDPRQKKTSFDRISASGAYTNTFLNNLWYTNTKVSYNGLIDWEGKDPDQIQDGSSQKTSNNTIRLIHNGKLSINNLFSRTLTYSIGYSYGINNSQNTKLIGVSSGLPIINTSTTGYHEVPFVTDNYLATGHNESRPSSFTAKVGNTFHVNVSEKFQQRFNMGVEYNNDVNKGKGYYDENPNLPFSTKEDGRPRAFYDIPALNTISAYFEDNLTFTFAKKRELNVQIGVRYMHAQPGKEEQTKSLSPRINARMDITKHIAVRGAYGLNSKAPGMNYLYPDKKYNDRLVAQYQPAGAKDEWIYYIHTQIYDVQRSKVKNVTNQRFELGLDIKLPKGRKMSVVAYSDLVDNGFGSKSGFTTYEANRYTVGGGLTPVPGSKPTIDWDNPKQRDIVWMGKGLIGNTEVAKNKGVEFDMDFGHFKSINTSFSFSGAYREMETWSNDIQVSNPSPIPNGAEVDASPFKLIYPTKGNKSVTRNFVATVRAICNIPQLRMVASIAYQNQLYNYSWSQRDYILPTAWLDNDLTVHEITPEMIADETYTIKGALLKQILPQPPVHDLPSIMKPLGRINARLSMEVTKNLGVSFYSTNLFYYEPWQTNNLKTTPSRKNGGTFSFGVEAVIKL